MQRPNAVTVFGVLNVVFAVFGILGVLASLVLFMPQAANSNNPVIKIMHDNPLYSAWIKLAIGLGVISVTVLMAAGVGLLQMKPWGRTLSIGYAIYAIIIAIVNAVVSFIWLTLPLLAQAQHQHGAEAAGAVGGAVGAVIGGGFAVMYPGFLLFFMLRPKIAATFRPGA